MNSTPKEHVDSAISVSSVNSIEGFLLVYCQELFVSCLLINTSSDFDSIPFNLDSASFDKQL
jgi:hypothetical protein